MNENKMSGKTFRCCKCDECFSKEFARDDHFKKSHTDIAPKSVINNDQTPDHECKLCFQRFEDDALLYKHLRAEGNSQTEAMIVCPSCSQKFTSSRGLLIHKTMVHVKEKQFKCTGAGCTKVFATNKTRWHHFKNTHNEIRFICDICKKSFGDKNALRKHVKIHIAVRSFSCLRCPKAFQQYAGLYAHIRDVHSTTERQFKCDACNQSYSCKRNLQKHFETIHNQNRSFFTCRFCTSDFATKYYRIRHEKNSCPRRKEQNSTR